MLMLSLLRLLGMKRVLKVTAYGTNILIRSSRVLMLYSTNWSFLIVQKPSLNHLRTFLTLLRHPLSTSISLSLQRSLRSQLLPRPMCPLHNHHLLHLVHRQRHLLLHPHRRNRLRHCATPLFLTLLLLQHRFLGFLLHPSPNLLPRLPKPNGTGPLLSLILQSSSLTPTSLHLLRLTTIVRSPIQNTRRYVVLHDHRNG